MPAKFTAEERAAMRERAKELKAEKGREADRKAFDAAVAKMNPTDKAIAKKLHAVITKAAPQLDPTTWYGMPAWGKDGQKLLYFRNAAKFKERYGMLGVNDSAKLDDGNVWAVSWAVSKIGPADEKKLAAMVKKAVG